VRLVLLYPPLLYFFLVSATDWDIHSIRAGTESRAG
jgi:hypothetical protein